MAGKEITIIHPRPSSIVAALYTLRDLNVDVAILHGPPAVLSSMQGYLKKTAYMSSQQALMRMVLFSEDMTGLLN